MNKADFKTRRHARSPVAISCEVTLAKQATHALTDNLSTGGAAIVFPKKLKVGEVVTVSLYLTQDGIEDPTRPHFECAASVRWTQPAKPGEFRSGLQFLGTSDEQRALLREFLAEAD